MAFGQPRSPDPTSDERELLLGFIRWQREQVVATAHGLTEEQLRWTPDERLLPIIGVLNHLTHMEWRWAEGRYLGSVLPQPPRFRRVNIPFSVRKPHPDAYFWGLGVLVQPHRHPRSRSSAR